MLRNCRVGILATGMIVLFSACNRDTGPKLFQVTGRVMYQDKPVEGATVTFIPADGSQTSFGTTDAEGKFSLKGGRGGDGAPLGTATATVTKSPAASAATPTAPAGAPGSAALPGGATVGAGGVAGTPAAAGGAALGETAAGATPIKSELPEKYSSIATSGLTFTVTDDPAKNNFEIVLTD